MIKRYFLSFIGVDPFSSGMYVKRTSLKHAKQLFAEYHNIQVSDYIVYNRKITNNLRRGISTINNNQWLG